MKKAKKKIHKITLVLLGVLCYHLGAMAQTITGTVTDQGNDPLIGVSVVEKGTTNGTITDLDGNYSISLKEEGATLKFSFVGYTTKEIEVGDKTVIDVTLTEDVKSLEEVVVVGYGTQTMKTLTGSVTQLATEEIQGNPSPDLSSALVGKVPGLVAIDESGQPGADDTKLRVRGIGTMDDSENAGSPLFVIDGVPQRGGFANLDPNDVENISILKDASAAIYGSRAANGVVIVTTKRGRTEEAKFNFTANYGLSQPTMKPDLASSGQLARHFNEQGLYDFSEAQIDSMERNLAPERNMANTDWWDASVNDWAPTTRYNLSVRGGSENVKYYLSGGLLDQKGIFPNSVMNFEQQNIRSNIDIKLNDYMNVKADLAGTFGTRTDPEMGPSEFIFWLVYRHYPWYPVKYPGDKWFDGMSDGWNPARMGSDEGGISTDQTNRYNSRFSYEIGNPWIEGLSIDGYFAYDIKTDVSSSLKKPWQGYLYDASDDTLRRVQNSKISSITVSEGRGNERFWTYTAKLNYENSFGKHNVKAFAAVEKSESFGEYVGASRRDFISDDLPYLNFGSTDDDAKENSGTAWQGARLNYLARLSYNYRFKYLLDFNIRRDGSTNFPPGSRFGTFPGISVAWRMSEEGFIENSAPFIDNLKVKASWGVLGRDNIAPFQYMNTYGLTLRSDINHGNFSYYDDNQKISA